MSYVLPSQAVLQIDRVFPEAKANSQNFALSSGHSAYVTVIVALVDQIPPELITLEGEDLAAYTASLAILKQALQIWRTHMGTFNIGARVPGFDMNVLALLRAALVKCPDEAPAKGTVDLLFITDTELREDLRLDISTTYRTLKNLEWKPATVLAGSIIEALLLWAIDQRPAADRTAAISALRSATPPGLSQNPNNDLNRWVLDELIKVAHQMGIIRDDTASHCDMGREFRNLIHAGRSLRLNMRCTRGTAYSTVGAMELVIEDLSR